MLLSPFRILKNTDILTCVMGNSNTNVHQETATKTGACKLSEMGLRKLPSSLGQLADKLRSLDVSHNSLEQVYLTPFPQLTHLTLSYNRLKSLPESEIDILTQLQVFSVDNNLLSQLRASFSKFLFLKSVNLSNNRFTILAAELCGLPKLDTVNMSSNSIAELPDNNGSLHVIEANFNRNQLTKLPEEQLARRECFLVEDPQEFTVSPLGSREKQVSNERALQCPGTYFQRFAANKKKFLTEAFSLDSIEKEDEKKSLK